MPRIVELVKSRIPKRFGLDPIRDIQVLCPMTIMTECELHGMEFGNCNCA